MEKKFQHKKIEKCKLCGKNVDTSKDNWAVIIDYEKRKQISIGFYHRQCLNDLIKGKADVIKRKFAENLKNFSRDVFGKLKDNKIDFSNYGEQLNESIQKIATT